MRINDVWSAGQYGFLFSFLSNSKFKRGREILLAELGREFPEVQRKGYYNKTLKNKANWAWDAILSKFNSQNTSGIKRDMNQIRRCWKWLKIQTKKEHGNQRRESRKTGGRKASPSPSVESSGKCPKSICSSTWKWVWWWRGICSKFKRKFFIFFPKYLCYDKSLSSSRFTLLMNFILILRLRCKRKRRGHTEEDSFKCLINVLYLLIKWTRSSSIFY